MSRDAADDHSSHHSGSETSAQPKLDFVPPRGVILIGDDEEEVQIGMQRRARAPRCVLQLMLTEGCLPGSARLATRHF